MSLDVNIIVICICSLYCNSNCNSDSRFCLCPVVKVLKSPENVSLRLKYPCEVFL